jgi:ABC-2 type transport system ATP-binding protein
MTNLVLETTGLTKRYGSARTGRIVVDDVDLTVRAGEVYGFLGPNGAGKTTTLRMILGLIRPTSGTARVLGRPAGGADVTGRVGALIEGPGFFPYLSGRDNLRTMARYRGLPDPAVDRALERVDLLDRGGDRFKSYSLGMKQRLGVASALMGEPELIVLDEPTNGLDPAGMQDMRALVVALARGGQTVVLSSHLLAEVQDICDRVGVINDGRLLRESTVAELRGATSLRIRATPVQEALAVARRLAGEAGARRSGSAGDQVTLDLPAASAPEVNRALVAAGVDVYEVAPLERSLEEVFFELTTSTPAVAPAPRQTTTKAMTMAEERAMSTATTDLARPGRTSTGLLSSTRAELLRLRSWPAVWVTLGVWMLLALMFGYLFNYFSYKTGDLSFSNQDTTIDMIFAELMPTAVPNVLLQGMPMFGGALMLVLGGLVAGSGYGWGTWKTVFIQAPSRRTAVAGSLLALTAIVVLIVLVTLALCFGVSATIGLSEGADLTWPTLAAVGKSVSAGCLVLELWALAGFTVGTLARGPALAVGLGLVWTLVVENLLRGVGSLLGPVEALTHGLPGTAAGSLVGSLTGVQAEAEGAPGVLDVISGTRATWTIVAYLVAFVVITLTATERRDVN